MHATMDGMANVTPLLTGDPEQLGAYRLVGRIGQGGQGTVYLARRAAGEPVAVKLLRVEWTRDPLARSRFAREVAAAGRVAPFCTARILDTRLDGDEPYVVSEFIDGPSLHEVVARHGPLAGSALDRLAVHTATALSAIHQAGVIHRDFKPGNVLMGPDGPRVIDFGIARWDDGSATITSQVLGTPGYMAPEVVRGQQAGPAADVFAWAATITYAATGTPPFHAPNMAAIVHQITSGEPDLGALGGHLRGIVASCLAKDPEARPTAFELLMRLLQHSVRGEPTPQVPVAWAGQTVPVAGEHALALGAAAVVGGAAAAGPAAAGLAGPGLAGPGAAGSGLAGPRAAGPGSAAAGGAGQADVLVPSRQPWPQQPQQPQPQWSQQPSPQPWPQQPWSARQGNQVPVQGSWYNGSAGSPPYAGGQVPGPGPAPRRRTGGSSAAGWAIVIAGLVLLGVLGRLLVPALISGPSSATGSSSTGSSSGSSPAVHHKTGARAPSARATTPAVAAPGNSIPSGFGGTWSGQAHQSGGVVKQWAAILVLPGGATTGQFSIPTIPCQAAVTVTQSGWDRLVLRETVVADPAHKCAAAGTISLRRVGADRAIMFWQETGDPANIATAVLTRA
jgi:hypothetical protein